MEEFEFSLSFVEKLIDLAKKKDVAKLSVSCKDFNVLVDLKQPIFAPGSANMPSLKKEEMAVQTEQEEEMVGNVVTSPIVGTFYIKPSPDKQDFVKVGDRVKKGDVLFIIESMKLMNEIKSEFDGVVKEILVSSGEGVEYEQPIMILE